MMAAAAPNALNTSLSNALGAITANRQAVKAAAATVFNPPPVEDHTPAATPAPGNAAKP